jgi:hypothetical protein
MAPHRANPGVARSSLAHTLTVAAEPGAGLLERILADVGPSRDAMTNGWLADVRNRTGRYWNGCGEPLPSFCH